jgi:signal transduction histidine kinase
VVLVSVGIMAYLTNINTANQFQQYVQGGGMMYIQRLVTSLQQYYDQSKSWKGVQEILSVSLRSSDERLVLSDASGIIVGDTSGLWLGKRASDLQIGTGSVIISSGQNIGSLYAYLTTGSQTGKGYMGGMGGQSRAATPTVTLQTGQTPENDFLSRINSYLWVAGLIAVALALALGFLLTRQIIRPIKALSQGAQNISSGNLNARVSVKSRDELGQLADSFNSMAVGLEKSEQSRKRLVSDVSHELRTPLTIIEGTVDGIIDGVFPPDREHLNSIKEQTNLLTHIVSDLRDLSLAESGQLKLEKQLVDLGELLNRKYSQFSVSAKAKNIRFTIDIESSLPDISIDPRRIEQVIGNLLANAIRHTPVEGTVTIQYKHNDSVFQLANSSVIITVKDSGEGIPAEHLPHIFERFYRVETSRAKIEGESGVGLGLAIVKYMVEAHGGQVKVESKPGKGSTFSVVLPLTYG